jgi:hypothetical protein
MLANLEKSLSTEEQDGMSTSSGDSDELQPIQYLMQLSNVDEIPPNKECTGVLTKEEHWKCFSIQFSYPTLRFPILFV